MICPRCGRNIPDGSVCPCSYGSPVLSSNPAVNALKTLGSSTLFLVAAILLTASPVLSVVGQMSLRDSISDLIFYAAQLDLDPSILYPAMQSMESVSIVTAVFSCIPEILIAVAMWITFTSSRNAQSGNVSTAGLTICKVLSIISLVGVCIGAAALLILLVVFLVAGANELGNAMAYDYYDASMAQAGIAVVVVLAIVLTAVLVLMIFYQVSVIKTINRIKATAVSGVPDNRVSNYLIVMNYILAVGSALGGLANLFTSPFIGLAGLVGAATLIIISILLSKYRSAMSLLMYPPVQPVYPGQMPPQGPGNPWG